MSSFENDNIGSNTSQPTRLQSRADIYLIELKSTFKGSQYILWFFYGQLISAICDARCVSHNNVVMNYSILNNFAYCFIFISTFLTLSITFYNEL